MPMRRGRPYIGGMRTMILFLLIVYLTASVHAQEDRQMAFLDAVSAVDAAKVRSMLESDPSLVAARKKNGASAVTLALFSIPKGGETFRDPAKNETLQAILQRNPKLDMYETAALGTTAQLDAMLRGDPGGLKRPNQFGWTLLHMSAFAGNGAVTEMLIGRGAEVNVRALSKFRNTPLQTAMLTGQYETAKILLDHGADALVRQAKGFTPMHQAAELGRRDLVQLLLDRGAEINSLSDSGETPLAEAIRGHHEELAAWMKEKGATLNPTPNKEVEK